jgi:hypothetical protein
MRDVRAFVREHLSPLELPRQREIKIVEELAAQLEEACAALVADGLSEEDAWIELQRQLPDWQTLRKELLEAEPVLVRFAQPRPLPVSGAARRSLVAGLR